MVGGKALPEEVLGKIVEKTDGVPLFVEELTKMLLGSGLLVEQADHYALTGPLPPLAIPATLQDSLMARLDRLSTVKEVAQLGATLGRSFSYELLHAVSPVDETTLQRELGRLVEAELLYQRGLPPQATYLFKHVLIQEAAYQSLLKRTRQQYHREIARVLEEQFQEIALVQPELLAHHYTEGGLPTLAVERWRDAGLRAMARSANLEAASHLSKALELLSGLPDSSERLDREVDLLTAIGPALIATKGQAAAEVEAAYTRARELCRQAGEGPQLFRVLNGLRLFYTVRGDLWAARAVAEELLELAEKLESPPRQVEGHYGLGNISFWLGEFETSIAHLEQAIARPYPDQSAGSIYSPIDPRVNCFAYLGWVWWVAGYPDRALYRSTQALALAEHLAHPHTRAVALDFAAALHEFRGEIEKARDLAETGIALCQEHRFPFWGALLTIRLGWARCAQGEIDDGIADMRRGLAAWSATGAELARPFLLGMLADSCSATGRVMEGLEIVDQALTDVARRREHFYEPELLRLKGELRLAGDPSARAEAEALFRDAMELAEQRQAKSLELRAAVSLSRSLSGRGEPDAARAVLEPVYGWFTEGFDTGDLSAAGALLERIRR
jgi:predicted ATPase